MVDVDSDRTREFNEFITAAIDELINNSNFNIYVRLESDNINEYVENNLLYNMFGNNVLIDSFNDDKGLQKNTNVRLNKFGIYTKDEECECCICMNEDDKIKKGSKIYECKGCKNVFHYNCMCDWVKMKVECPTCRNILEDDVIYVDEFEEWLNENIDI